MSLAVRGMGWVTPLGHDVNTVWEKLLRGEEAKSQEVSSSLSSRAYQAFRISESLPAHSRLRRSSAISRFAVAAGLAALEDAGLKESIDVNRVALIFATSNGGVIYTRRFYHDIVDSGAHKASPLLFPETVFNAPASHLSAILGITGTNYTLVGDGAVGILALKMAEDLMQNGSFDHCLVIGAEEVDWLLCDAYRKWRLLRDVAPIEPFASVPRGMLLSEGAGAILLSHEGPIRIDQIHAGSNYERRGQVAGRLRQILDSLNPNQPEIVIGSANGTFIDLAEWELFQAASLVYTLKPALGESLGASAIWQVIAGAQVLLTRQIPPVLHSCVVSPRIPRERTRNDRLRTATILTCGLSEQVGGLRLSLVR